MLKLKKIYIIIKKLKNPSNIGIKVPDMEWETTGRNVRPPASNENPGSTMYNEEP